MTPLVNISVDVEQTPSVRQFAAGRFCSGRRINRVAIQQRFFITVTVRGRSARSAGVLPFGLGWQAVAVCFRIEPPRIVFFVSDCLLFSRPLVTGSQFFLSAQPVAEQHRIVPIDMLDRMLFRVAVFGVRRRGVLRLLSSGTFRIVDEVLKMRPLLGR